MIQQWWGEPTAGEIVWCHFPDDIHPRPKPRPALILAVFDDDAPQFVVRVAYGTSQRTTTLRRGEFSILRDRNPTAYAAAGLSYDTRFDLKQALDLPYSKEWFSVPPAAPHGQTPRLSVLQPSLVRAVQAGFRAAAVCPAGYRESGGYRSIPSPALLACPIAGSTSILRSLADVLMAVTVRCYYGDDRVMRSFGMEPRAPYPQGHEVEQGDWSLLEPVRARGPIWRGVPDVREELRSGRLQRILWRRLEDLKMSPRPVRLSRALACKPLREQPDPARCHSLLEVARIGRDQQAAFGLQRHRVIQRVEQMVVQIAAQLHGAGVYGRVPANGNRQIEQIGEKVAHGVGRFTGEHRAHLGLEMGWGEQFVPARRIGLQELVRDLRVPFLGSGAEEPLQRHAGVEYQPHGRPDRRERERSASLRCGASDCRDRMRRTAASRRRCSSTRAMASRIICVSTALLLVPAKAALNACLTSSGTLKLMVAMDRHDC